MFQRIIAYIYIRSLKSNFINSFPRRRSANSMRRMKPMNTVRRMRQKKKTVTGKK